VRATPLSWNTSLPPGGNTSIGFNGSRSGTNNPPTAFALNGQACTVG
jgi:hypothetical protein